MFYFISDERHGNRFIIMCWRCKPNPSCHYPGALALGLHAYPHVEGEEHVYGRFTKRMQWTILRGIGTESMQWSRVALIPHVHV